MKTYNTDTEAQQAHKAAATRNANDMRERIKARDLLRNKQRQEKRAFQHTSFQD